jgi:hypothetical protein
VNCTSELALLLVIKRQQRQPHGIIRFFLPLLLLLLLLHGTCSGCARNHNTSLASANTSTMDMRPHPPIIRLYKEGDTVENRVRLGLTEHGLLDTSKLATCHV